MKNCIRKIGSETKKTKQKFDAEELNETKRKKLKRNEAKRSENNVVSFAKRSETVSVSLHFTSKRKNIRSENETPTYVGGGGQFSLLPLPFLFLI